MPSGEVCSFDDVTGFGEVIDASDGTVYSFHSAAIADGSGTIEVGATVEFDLVPGEIGRWDVTNISGHLVVTTFLCPVCGAAVEGEPLTYEICPVCDWEDDPVQRTDPAYSRGANPISLDDARHAWSVRHRLG